MGNVYINQHHIYIDDELEISLHKEKLRENDDFLCFSQELYDEENQSLLLEWIGKYPAPKSAPVELNLELIGKIIPDQHLIIINNQQQNKPLSNLSFILTHPLSAMWLKIELEKEIGQETKLKPQAKAKASAQPVTNITRPDKKTETQSFLNTWVTKKDNPVKKEDSQIVDVPTRPKLITIPNTSQLTPEQASKNLYQTVKQAEATHMVSKEEVLYYLDNSELSWDDLRKNQLFDHDLHFALSLTNPVTTVKTAEKVYQAKKVKDVLSLEQAASLIEPGVCVVISDVHGNITLLQETLYRLNIIDKNNKRVDPEHKLVSIGDLIDGRDPDDEATLNFGDQVFDHIICGNHEAAFLGGPSFDGQVEQPEIKSGLRRMLWTQRLDAAIEEQGVLITHAGYDHTNPQHAAQELQQEWIEHCQREDPQNKTLFAIDRFRGGISSQGGAMWASWNSKVKSSQGKQIVGHTPLGESEKTKNSYNIDLTGNRLGVALIKEGEIIIASSLNIVD